MLLVSSDPLSSCQTGLRAPLLHLLAAVGACEIGGTLQDLNSRVGKNASEWMAGKLQCL